MHFFFLLYSFSSLWCRWPHFQDPITIRVSDVSFLFLFSPFFYGGDGHDASRSRDGQGIRFFFFMVMGMIFKIWWWLGIKDFFFYDFPWWCQTWCFKMSQWIVKMRNDKTSNEGQNQGRKGWPRPTSPLPNQKFLIVLCFLIYDSSFFLSTMAPQGKFPRYVTPSNARCMCL